MKKRCEVYFIIVDARTLGMKVLYTDPQFVNTDRFECNLYGTSNGIEIKSAACPELNGNGIQITIINLQGCIVDSNDIWSFIRVKDAKLEKERVIASLKEWAEYYDWEKESIMHNGMLIPIEKVSI